MQTNFLQRPGLGFDNFPERLSGALRQRYQQDDKLPAFLVDDLEFPSLSFANYFVNLAIVNNDYKAANSNVYSVDIDTATDQHRDIHQLLLLSDQIQNVDTLFSFLNNENTAGWLCITGEAGAGKTTILQYISYLWGSKNSYFEFVFRIKLNLINTSEFRDALQANNLEDLVLLIHHSLNNCSEISREAIQQCLMNYPEKVLLLLDGFDEIQTLYMGNNRVKALIDKAMSFPSGIMSSRTGFIYAKWLTGSESRFQQHFETIGFTESNIKKYVKNYFLNASAPEKAEKLLGSIFTNSKMTSLAQIPVNLVALCLIWNDDVEQKSIFSMTMLYHELILSIFRRYVKKFKCTQEEIEAGFDPKTALPDEIFSRCQIELDSLSKLAYGAFIGGTRQIISSTLLAKYIPEQKILFQISQRLSILRPVNKLETSARYSAHYFMHLSFQEYLTALYIAKALSKPRQDAGQKEFERRTLIQNLAIHIRNNRDNREYLMVWQFLSGLITMSEYRDAADYFLDAWLPTFLPNLASLVGLHPHIQWLQKSHKILHDAFFTHYACRTSGDDNLPERLETLKNSYTAFFQWKILCQQRAFLSFWDKKAVNKISRQQREDYQRYQRQYQQELKILGVMQPLDSLLVYKFCLCINPINFPALQSKILGLLQSGGDWFAQTQGIESLFKLNPSSPIISGFVSNVNQHPAIYPVRLLLSAADIALQLKLSQGTTDFFNDDSAIIFTQPQNVYISETSPSHWELTAHSEGSIFGSLYIRLLKYANTKKRPQRNNTVEYTLNESGNSKPHKRIVMSTSNSKGLNIDGEDIEIAGWLLKTNPNDKLALHVLHLGLQHSFFNEKAIKALMNVSAEDEITLGHIQKILSSSHDENEVFISAIALLEINSNDSAALAVLRQMLGNDTVTEEMKIRVASELYKRGYFNEEVTSVIDTALRNSRYILRAIAANAILKINPNNDQALSVFQETIEREDVYFSSDAIFNLCEIRSKAPRTLLALKQALNSRDQYIQEAAALTFRHIAELFDENDHAIIDFLLEFVRTEQGLEVLLNISIVLLRITPSVYATMPRFFNDKKIIFPFARSLWLHNSSLWLDQNNLIVNDSVILGWSEISEEVRNIFIGFCQEFYDSFIESASCAYLTLPGLLNILRRPIQLSLMTRVFQRDFLTENLPMNSPNQTVIMQGVAPGAQFVNSTLNLIQILNHYGEIPMFPARSEESVLPASQSNAAHIAEDTTAIDYRYPYDSECAFMAKLVYLNEAEQRSELPFAGKKKENVLQAHYQHWRESGWEFIPNLNFYHDIETGYIGSAYVNHRLKQVVIAHRGTKLDNWGSLVEDYQSIFHNSIGTQMCSAFGYYRRVINEFRGRGADNLISPSTKLSGYQLSFTGHSLGAWLAELCALDAYLQFGLYLHTVTFDCPGSLPLMKNMLQNDPAKVAGIPMTLDITGFYGQPNLINVINPHVGTQHQITTSPDACCALAEWLFYTDRMHAMTDLLEAFDLEHGCLQNGKAQKITRWPHHNALADRTNEYTLFHKFLSEKKNLAPATFKREFERLYRANYDTSQHRTYEFSLRNVHPLVKEFLKGYHTVRVSLRTKIADAELREYLEEYDIVKEGNNEVFNVGSSSTLSAQQIVFKVMSYLSQHPGIFQDLAQALNFDNRIQTLASSSQQQTLARDYPAIMTAISAEVRDANVTIQQTFARLPRNPRPEDYKFFAAQTAKYPIEMIRMDAIAKPVYGGTYYIAQTMFDLSGATRVGEILPAANSSSSAQQTENMARVPSIAQSSEKQTSSPGSASQNGMYAANNSSARTKSRGCCLVM